MSTSTTTTNQPTTVGVYHLVFLILEGRVNCLLTRNLCFKTYVKGSYFGDFEYFRNCTRMFSVRAETNTMLMKISNEALTETFKVFKEAELIIMKRSFERYLKYRISIKLIRKYGMITMNDEYWVSELSYGRTRVSNTFHNKIEEWLNRVSIIREDLNSQ